MGVLEADAPWIEAEHVCCNSVSRGDW
jgi:hypothetical protein